MLKKIIKIVLLIILILLVMWGIIFAINVIRCLNYEKPILYLYAITDEYTAEYYCMGYTIEASIYSKGIGRTQMKFFHTKLFETELLEERCTYYEDKNGIKIRY